MNQSHPPKDDQPPPRLLASPSKEEAKQQRQAAQAAIEAARDTLARTHQVFDRTRQLITKTEELFQHAQARREHEAEQTALHASADSARAPTVSSVPAAPLGAVGVLLVEDNPADIRLFCEALTQCALPQPVAVLTCGREVEAFIRQEAVATCSAPPRLIIMDFRILGMEAAEALATLRRLPAYAGIPVLLFSSLDETEGQRRIIELGATAFIQKPAELKAFCAAGEAMAGWQGGEGDGLARDSGQEGMS
jgi:chemotaxis family two-component system response regulator Rcp1